jgi:hypothetical protein
MMAALTGDRKSVLEGTWALGAIAIVVVLLRILAKARLRHLGTDDVTMIASLVSPCQQLGENDDTSPIYSNP